MLISKEHKDALVKENKKRLEKAKMKLKAKEKQKMKEHLKQLKKIHKVNSYGTKSDHRGVIANTRHLKRILIYLKEVVDYTWCTDAKENCCIPPNKVPDALLFLENHNLIKSKITPQNQKRYYLPEKEELVNKIIELEAFRIRLKYRKVKKKWNPANTVTK